MRRVGARRSLTGLLLTLAASLVPAQPGGEASPDVQEPPNPHWSGEACALCHGGAQPGALSAAEGEALCARCHDPASVAEHIHPLGMPPGRLAPQMEAHGVPLVEGRVGCLSCHSPLHQCRLEADTWLANPLFLREPPGGGLATSCFLCHPEAAFRRFNPHSQVAEDGTVEGDVCRLCHRGVPDPPGPAGQAAADLRADRIALCRNCHPMGDHPGAVNHLITANEATVRQMIRTEHADRLGAMTADQVRRYLQTQRLEPTLLPLGPAGEITCTTCHNPHDQGIFPDSNPLSRGAETSPARTHRLRLTGGDLCAACHDI